MKRRDFLKTTVAAPALAVVPVIEAYGSSVLSTPEQRLEIGVKEFESQFLRVTSDPHNASGCTWRSKFLVHHCYMSGGYRKEGEFVDFYPSKDEAVDEYLNVLSDINPDIGILFWRRYPTLERQSEFGYGDLGWSVYSRMSVTNGVLIEI